VRALPRDWESTFSGWTGAAGSVEDDKAQRVLQRVRNAIANSRELQAVDVSVYPKGSYPNRTNVVQDSDMDVAVELTSIIHHEFWNEAEGLTIQDLGLRPYTGTYRVSQFKDHVEAALVAEFDRSLVERGNKALRVKATSSTLAADVVACQTVEVHFSRYSSATGIKIWPDRGLPIINFPNQHLQQGLRKNQLTYRRYKRTVRILKRLENQMVRERVIEVVPSFLIESLVWNVPEQVFTVRSSWTDIVRGVLVLNYEATKDDESAKSQLEANAIKFLFHLTRAWTRPQAHNWTLAAWRYLGF